MYTQYGAEGEPGRAHEPIVALGRLPGRGASQGGGWQACRKGEVPLGGMTKMNL